MMKRDKAFRWACVLLAGLWLTPALADEHACGSLDHPVGPWDYTNAEHLEKYIRPIVDRNHFNSDVRNLVRGQSASILGDLNFILRAVPNHHLALNSMSRYFLQGGSRESFYTAECYFDRALRFKPEDPVVHLLYGIHLHKQKDSKNAEDQYLQAISLRPGLAEAHYNIGLLYTDLGRWDEARTQALEAYRLGHPFNGLKNRLKTHGRWTEADDAAVASGAASPR